MSTQHFGAGPIASFPQLGTPSGGGRGVGVGGVGEALSQTGTFPPQGTQAEMGERRRLYNTQGTHDEVAMTRSVLYVKKSKHVRRVADVDNL